MKIRDYNGPLQIFGNYEIRLIEMIIDELSLKSFTMFKFLNEINIYKDVEFFYYNDKRNKVKEGFYPSTKNVIYINLNGRENETYKQRANNIIKFFPYIMHELYHYIIFKNKRVSYRVMNLPLVRMVSIEINANKIKKSASRMILRIKKMSNMTFSIMKMRHKFPRYLFDEDEKSSLRKEGIWTWF